MRKLRHALVIALAGGSMLIVAQAASAKNVWTGDRGYGSYHLNGFGTTIFACDRDADGIGVVAFILDRHKTDTSAFLTNVVGAVDRGGNGTCGESQSANVHDATDLWVRVCLHDKSKAGRGVSSPFDPTLEHCVTKNVPDAGSF